MSRDEAVVDIMRVCAALRRAASMLLVAGGVVAVGGCGSAASTAHATGAAPGNAGAGAGAAPVVVRVYAAGSLRQPLTRIAREFEQAEHATVRLTFGPSGELRDRIAAGEAVDLFASANVAHPESLARTGRGEPVAVFARNRLCALARAAVDVDTATLLERMLDPALRLATSTPKSDPAGDYTWAMFAKAEQLRPGAERALQAKAMQLVGGPASPPAPPDRSAYGALLAADQADLFITYCTSAAQAKTEQPALQVIALPEQLAVGTAYGMTVVAQDDAARALARKLAAFMLAAGGQQVLRAYGFAAP